MKTRIEAIREKAVLQSSYMPERDDILWLLDQNRDLRAAIQYAIDGPDADLAEIHGGRAIDCCKAILRDALEVKG